MRRLPIIIVSLSFFAFLACNGNSNADTTSKVSAKKEVIDAPAPAEKPIAEASSSSETAPTTTETPKPTEVVEKTLAPKAKEAPAPKPSAPKAKETTIPKTEKPPVPVKTTAPKVEEKTKKTETISTTIEKPKAPAPKALSHIAWDELLRKYVSSTGKVNYKGIKGDKAKLEAYLKDLSANPVQSDWSRSKKMAYWINAYNAFTIKLIVDNYPVSSITGLHGGKPWDVKWIKLGSDTYSLNDIENNILRPRFKDARIHFAVNCAAKSCPPVLNRAWTAANLESNFEKQTKAFINGSLNDISVKKINVSKIFDWYKEDFGDLIGFLNKYSSTSINKGAKINFVEYDWNLNE